MADSVSHRYRNDRGKLTIGWRFIAGICVGVLLATFVSIVEILPYKPETWIGWCLVVIFVPLGEIVGELVWGFWETCTRRMVSIDLEQTSSLVRIPLSVLGILFLCGMFYMASYFVGPPIAAFLAPHFSTW